MPSIKTNRLYNRYPDTEASKFAGVTIKGFTGNPDLPNPPVMPDALAIMKQTLDEALVAANKGGTLSTAVKDAARAALNTALDKNASYVDINCDDDMTILLSSGYEPASTNRVSTPLDPPVILGADYGQSGEIKLRVKGDGNRRGIQGRCKTVGGEWGPVITFATSRRIVFNALVAGTTYIFELCGLGGSTGQSDWSNPISKIAL